MCLSGCGLLPNAKIRLLSWVPGPSSISASPWNTYDDPSAFGPTVSSPSSCWVKSSSRTEGTKDLSSRCTVSTGLSRVKSLQRTLEAMKEGHTLKATTADPSEGCQNCQQEGCQVSLPEVFKNKSLA